MPHNAMAALFGAAFLYAIVALAWACAHSGATSAIPSASTTDAAALWQAIRDAGELRYLDGGGVGCYNDDERPNDRRTFYHHLTFYGFVLCFASTCVATLYHYLLGARGAVSVVGPAGRARHARRHRAVFGPIGLLIAKCGAIRCWWTQQRYGMDVAFIACCSSPA